MELDDAVKRLSALAQNTRLDIFRLLVKAGPDGVAAGEIARTLAIPPNTLSTHLQILANCDLVQVRRESRSRIYVARFDAMGALLAYLMEDCCQGKSEVCAPIFEIAANCGPSAHPKS